MNADIAHKACGYLNDLKHGLCIHATPVSVMLQFNKSIGYVFYGARYDAVHVCVPTERDVTDGAHKAGDRVPEPAFYLVGDIPDRLMARTRSGEFKHVFRFPDDDGDWFIAGYHVGHWKDQLVCPFGAYFILKRWDHEKPWMGRIDQHADSPDIRLTAEATLLL